ncbi:MAG: cyd operon YbgE family protein [Zoogloea sp.]|uniref:cyd operon YbgE family protein n=1 Tax=Zoogloea sp. TaxID=49181 RepID=UPI00261E8BE0|nr:cyd operon YbgE family protein [Zoogloea sp.]MDD3325954.1 cyd operon YbgE family protein [Zoogloea sp.]
MHLKASGRPDPGARLLSLVTGALLAVLLVVRPEIALDRWGVADPLAALWLLWSMLAGLASGTGWPLRRGALRQLLSSEACLITLVLAFLRLATH